MLIGCVSARAIRSCDPIHAFSGGGGGLLYVDDGATFTGVGVNFHDGRAVYYGGAVALSQGHFQCAGCTFQNNTAHGNGIYDHGGAISNHNFYGSVVLDAPTFTDNTPSPGDDCKCAGYCTGLAPTGNCSAGCANDPGGPLKCCVCSVGDEGTGGGCPACCVAPGDEPISGSGEGFGCYGMPYLNAVKGRSLPFP